MSTYREQLEHVPGTLVNADRPKWRKWVKKQMNRFIRRQNKKIEDDDIGSKGTKRQFLGWEW